MSYRKLKTTVKELENKVYLDKINKELEGLKIDGLEFFVNERSWRNSYSISVYRMNSPYEQEYYGEKNMRELYEKLIGDTYFKLKVMQDAHLIDLTNEDEEKDLDKINIEEYKTNNNGIKLEQLANRLNEVIEYLRSRK